MKNKPHRTAAGWIRQSDRSLSVKRIGVHPRRPKAKAAWRRCAPLSLHPACAPEGAWPLDAGP